MFFLDLQEVTNNKDIYNITLLLNTVVAFEAAYAKELCPSINRVMDRTYKNVCHKKLRFGKY